MAVDDDEPIDVAGLVAAGGDPYWRRTYHRLRLYRAGLRPDDRVARCGCGQWVIHPADAAGRDAATIPPPWASKRKGHQPVCRACAYTAGQRALAEGVTA